MAGRRSDGLGRTRRSVLRIAATLTNIVTLHGDSIRRGTFANSFGDRPVGWINVAGRCGSGDRGLLHPERFDGPSAIQRAPRLNHHDIAEILTQVLGRSISFPAISRDEWRRELIDLSEISRRVVNRAMAAHISNVGNVAARCATCRLRRTELAHRPDAGLIADFLRDQRLTFEADRSSQGSAIAVLRQVRFRDLAMPEYASLYDAT
jgi:hypothetical protein